MNRMVRTVIKIILIVFFLWVLSLAATTRIHHLLYEYKRVNYGNEIEVLFNEKFKKRIEIIEEYQSGKCGTIYFASVDSLHFLVIEATNFIKIVPELINTEIIEKTNLTDWKTYSTIFHDGFPVIQAVMNPKKSDYLRILLEEPMKVEYKAGKSNHFYLSGKFKSITFSNSQNCYIISFYGYKQDILVLKNNNKLFLIAGETNNTSLLEILNPEIL